MEKEAARTCQRRTAFHSRRPLSTCYRAPWNTIEHRLFSFISINWRAKPLTSLEVVLELMRAYDKTNEGLTVMALKDSNPYPTGLKVTDDELAVLNLLHDPFHGEWKLYHQASTAMISLFPEIPLVGRG